MKFQSLLRILANTGIFLIVAILAGVGQCLVVVLIAFP